MRAGHSMSPGTRLRVTSSNVAVLDGDARLQELSRMMGGDATSAAGLEHARELLDQAAALRAAPRRGR